MNDNDRADLADSLQNAVRDFLTDCASILADPIAQQLAGLVRGRDPQPAQTSAAEASSRAETAAAYHRAEEGARVAREQSNDSGKNDRGAQSEGSVAHDATSGPEALYGVDKGRTSDDARFRRFVERVSGWSDDELPHVSAEQTRLVAQAVLGGLDPTYPPFGKAFAHAAVITGGPSWLDSWTPEKAGTLTPLGTIWGDQPGVMHGSGVVGLSSRADIAKAEAAGWGVRYPHAYRSTTITAVPTFLAPGKTWEPKTVDDEPAATLHQAIDKATESANRQSDIIRAAMDPTPEEQRERFDTIASHPRPDAVNIREALLRLEEDAKWIGENEWGSDWRCGPAGFSGPSYANDMRRAAAIMDSLGVHCTKLELERDAAVKRVAEVEKAMAPVEGAELAELVQEARRVIDLHRDQRPGSIPAIMTKLVEAAQSRERRIGVLETANTGLTAENARLRTEGQPRTYTDEQRDAARNVVFERFRNGDQTHVQVSTTTGELVDLIASALGLERAK